jgi:hypothetical protein
MSGAEPCTGSNIDGCSRVGSRFADGAMPMEPATAAAGGGGDLGPDAVPGDDRHPMGRHDPIPTTSKEMPDPIILVIGTTPEQ